MKLKKYALKELIILNNKKYHLIIYKLLQFTESQVYKLSQLHRTSFESALQNLLQFAHNIHSLLDSTLFFKFFNERIKKPFLSNSITYFSISNNKKNTKKYI